MYHIFIDHINFSSNKKGKSPQLYCKIRNFRKIFNVPFGESELQPHEMQNLAQHTNRASIGSMNCDGLNLYKFNR